MAQDSESESTPTKAESLKEADEATQSLDPTSETEMALLQMGVNTPEGSLPAGLTVLGAVVFKALGKWWHKIRSPRR